MLRVLPFIFTCMALTLLYAVVPYRYVPPRDALIGGIIAGIAFEIAKRAFAAYLARSASLYFHVAGATYRIVDRRARAGVTYTYRLQAVMRDGSRSWLGQSTARTKRST